MEEELKKNCFVQMIETGFSYFKDERAKPRVSPKRIRDALELFGFKNFSIEEGHIVHIKEDNIIKIGNMDKTINEGKYHYYAQYNSGTITKPWYGIPNSVWNKLCDLGVKENLGFFFLYFLAENNNIDGKINEVYLQVISDDEDIKNMSIGVRTDPERYLLNYNWVESEKTYMLNNTSLKMEKMRWPQK